MEYIREITINEAVIHILDNNSDEPIINEFRLELNEDLYKFLLKHIERCMKDEELKYAVFNQERNIVKEVTQGYLNGESDLLLVSKELARQLFILMKSNINIPSCDLMVVSFSTEFGPMLGILKMDYVKNYTHKIDFVEEKIGINIVPHTAGLPTSGQKLQKCAFIKPMREGMSFNLMVIDKSSKSKEGEEYGSNYFISNYLGCSIVNNERDMTKTFIKAAETWTRSNVSTDADKAETIRSTIKQKLKNEDQLDVRELSEDLFKESETAKADFVQFITAQGLEEKVTIDKEWVDKKLKRVRLKIDKDIDLYINEEAYNDNSKFEIVRNGDGSINMIIKRVINYIEK
jgi:nucleoid-associated protein YejK